MAKFSKFLLKLAGWKTITTFESPAKSVICVAPHTSNWDYIIGQLYYWSGGKKGSFLIKNSWFVFPFGIIFKKLGGVPVDRSKKTSVTQQMVNEFNNRDSFQLAITPEGTRKKVRRWKMGFYHIALEANVPIQLAFIDYKKKEVGITKMIYPSGNEAEDMIVIYDYYKDVTACHPDKFYLPKSENYISTK